MTTTTTVDYATVVKSLLPPQSSHPLLSLPVSPRKPHIPSQNITQLSVHPVIESALHILNLDLPSAHFLLRHMQAQPAWEAMYLHGILHRVEGDLDNARAWYGDVKDSDVFQSVWEKIDSTPHENGKTADESSTEAFSKAMSFIDQVEVQKNSLLSQEKRRSADQPLNGNTDLASLIEMSVEELRGVLSFCERKFGTVEVVDASKAWISMNEKHADQAAQMITGGEGWREF
jgi:hypothetical protein